jgi:hypothetical protein
MGFPVKEYFLKNAKTIIALYVGVLASAAVAVQPTGVTIQGEAQTSNLSQEMTLGSANIRLRITQGAEVKLQCGILGVRQTINSDRTAVFQHTVTCDDRSIFLLTTLTVISPTGVCTLPNVGIIGTFHETSDLVGIAGPYRRATGNVSIDGTIDCGFNKMSIQGSLIPAPAS